MIVSKRYGTKYLIKICPDKDWESSWLKDIVRTRVIGLRDTHTKQLQ